MHINTIEINGFKRIKEFSLAPKGASVELIAGNGQGKSSFLDAIYCTLTGKDIPKNAIHSGCMKAEVIVGLSEGHTVTMTIGQSGKKLVIEGPDGEKVKAPAEFLEKLIGDISFNPFEFIRKQPAEQKKILMDLLGLDFSDLDAKKREILDEKGGANATLVRATKELTELVDVQETAPVDMAELLAQQEDRRKASARIQEINTGLTTVNQRIEAEEAEMGRLRTEIDRLTKLLAEAKQRHEGLSERLADGTTALEEAVASFEKLPDPTEAIAKSSETNVNAERWARKSKLKAEKQAAEVTVSACDQDLQAIEQERIKRLKEAKFPVEGLEFSDVGVTFEGFPFDEKNQSTSAIMRVGIAIAVAQNPNLKVARIPNGQNLDDDNRAKVLALLGEYGFQTFIETVGSGELKALVLEEVG
jgi:archaellum component FlaC